MIAGAANQVVQAGSFTSEDDYGIGREVIAVVILGAVLIEADDPEMVLFEGFEGANEVNDAGDPEMLGGAGRGFDGDGAQRSGAAFGEEDAIDTGALGRAQKRAEVLRIFHPVERQHEAGRGLLAGRRFRCCEQIFQSEEVALAHDGDDTLMGRGLGDSGKSLAGLGTDRDGGFPAQGSDGGETRILPTTETLGGDTDMVEAAGPGAQSLFDRVKAVQNLHRCPSLSLPEVLNGLILEELQTHGLGSASQGAECGGWI